MSDETSQNGNENTQTQNTNSGNDTQVTMSQEQLNNLINGKFAKGAEKAKTDLLNELGIDNVDTLKEVLEKQKAQEEANKSELEKLQEQLEAEKVERERLANSLSKTTKQAKLNKIAAENGIEDVDYLEYQYDKNSTNEGFDEKAFIEGFVTKNKKSVNVDNSSNQNNDANKLDLSGIKDINQLKRLAKQTQ